MLSLWELFKKHNYTKNSIVYKEGDNTDGIYFVKQGEIEVKKKTFFIKIANILCAMFNKIKVSKKVSLPNDPAILSKDESKVYLKEALNNLNNVWNHKKQNKICKRIKVLIKKIITFQF